MCSTPPPIATSWTPEAISAAAKLIALLGGAALAVDGRRRDLDRQAGLEPGVAADVHPLLAELLDAAADHVADLERVDPGAARSAPSRRSRAASRDGCPCSSPSPRGRDRPAGAPPRRSRPHDHRNLLLPLPERLSRGDRSVRTLDDPDGRSRRLRHGSAYSQDSAARVRRSLLTLPARPRLKWVFLVVWLLIAFAIGAGQSADEVRRRPEQRVLLVPARRRRVDQGAGGQRGDPGRRAAAAGDRLQARRRRARPRTT